MNTQSPPSMIPPGRALDDAYNDAYAMFVLEICRKPQPLEALNSLSALRRRRDEVQRHIAACRRWLKALAEDTSQHVSAGRRMADDVEAHMGDLESEVIGTIDNAIPDTQVA